MREEAWGVGMGQGGGGNGRIELLDLGVKGSEQFETVVAALRGIGRQRKRPPSSHPSRVPCLAACTAHSVSRSRGGRPAQTSRLTTQRYT